MWPRMTIAALVLLTGSIPVARADESGTGFWLPGQSSSFAAIAPAPGFSLPLSTYLYSGGVQDNVALQHGRNLDLGVESRLLGQLIVPTYTPDIMILGARPSFSLALFPAHVSVTADARIGDISRGRSDTLSGFGDLYPKAQLYWAAGVNNWMAYVTGDVPVGAYQADRLANLGIGHGAIDAGGAYTYLNSQTGLEFSATAGVTYNLENPDTNVTSGVDAHLDWGVSQYLGDKLFVGAAGYAYQQLTADDGQPPILGSGYSRVFAIGPQIGYNFNLHDVTIYTNLRVYFEFGAENRTEGQAAYLTINLPLSQLSAAPGKKTADW